MITREQARDVLLKVADCGILSEDIEVALDDIVRCINMEIEAQISPWGMPDDDYYTLVACVRTDMSEYYEEHQKKCREIAKKYHLKIGE